ncbi:MAG: glycosyltransferase family 39 protein [Proteobacteria bacterium]|nr:glycosyltransferase family 39 protein [Pseudomonadota bacterium]
MLKTASLLLWLLVIVLQIWLLNDLQLFGDEAFYWLEGQHLAWSYAELPGWTAWMIRLGTELFGQTYFAVRFFSFLAYLSLYWVIYLFNNKVISVNLCLPISMPIIAIVAIMALPDIWLLFFVMWSSYFVTQAINSTSKHNWVILGILLACSINVHVRMWIWLFFAGVTFLGIFYTQKHIIKAAVFITLPLALLGLIPVLVFNIKYGFPLLDFQFSQRHPWHFQISNINFLLAQIVVVTPIVLLLWFRSVVAFTHDKFTNWLLITALLHWLFYIFMSFFVDGLRINIHWLIISYLPVLVMCSASKLKNWALISGGLITLLMLLFLSLNQHINQNRASNLQARIFDNSIGWQQLAATVKEIQATEKINNIVADYFMTAAELAFEMNSLHSIKVLSHKKNIKHGREIQLQIMHMQLQNPTAYKQPALLVVEDTAIKLQDKGKYYQNLCKTFKQIKFIQSVNINNSNKQYHVFKINGSVNSCEFPPLFYLDQEIIDNKIKISGWVVADKIGIYSLTIISGKFKQQMANDNIKNVGISSQFPEINDPNAPYNGFAIELPLSSIEDGSFRITIVDNNKVTYSTPLFYLK